MPRLLKNEQGRSEMVIKKLIWYFVAVAIVALFGATAAFAGNSTTGNGAPSGPHYNLTILGSKTCKNPPLLGGNRHTIFVPLVTSGDLPGTEPDTVSPDTAIWLTQGPFAVCDGNACDPAFDCSGAQIQPAGAVFQLPCDILVGGTVAPCTGNSAAYTVWAEALGKPGGNAQITTCATDIATNTVVCSTSNVVLVRTTSKPHFSNVTDQLTSLTCTSTTCPNLCSSGSCIFELFAAGFQSFFWDYDNAGLKNAQIRFYLQ